MTKTLKTFLNSLVEIGCKRHVDWLEEAISAGWGQKWVLRYNKFILAHYIICLSIKHLFEYNLCTLKSFNYILKLPQILILKSVCQTCAGMFCSRFTAVLQFFFITSIWEDLQLLFKCYPDSDLWTARVTLGNPP